MRVAVATLLLIFLALTTYQMVMSSTQPKIQSVHIEGKKLILTGFENPKVQITGCGQTENFTSSIIDIDINCSEITVKIYSHNELAFSGTFPLNP
ncbi:hypothetical protein [Archaeoglobus sp.]